MCRFGSHSAVWIRLRAAYSRPIVTGAPRFMLTSRSVVTTKLNVLIELFCASGRANVPNFLSVR